MKRVLPTQASPPSVTESTYTQKKENSAAALLARATQMEAARSDGDNRTFERVSRIFQRMYRHSARRGYNKDFESNTTESKSRMQHESAIQQAKGSIATLAASHNSKDYNFLTKNLE